jgi:hypothetical protein
MPTNEPRPVVIDWSLTTSEGARREQTRRWAKMTLAEIIPALEEMQVLVQSACSRRRFAETSRESA